MVFLEPPTHEKPHLSANYPEPYSLELIGMERYVEAYRVYPQQRTPKIESHAAAMAWKLQGADPLASTCVVISLNCWIRVLDAMEIPQEEPPPPRMRLFHTAELFNLHPDCLAEITSEAPYYQELYEDARAGKSVRLHWTAHDGNSPCCAKPRKNTASIRVRRCSPGNGSVSPNSAAI